MANASTKSAIPRIKCPQCGQQLRLSVIEPEQALDRERMIFTCECGFDYRQSHAVGAEHAAS